MSVISFDEAKCLVIPVESSSLSVPVDVLINEDGEGGEICHEVGDVRNV